MNLPASANVEDYYKTYTGVLQARVKDLLYYKALAVGDERYDRATIAAFDTEIEQLSSQIRRNLEIIRVFVDYEESVV